MNVSVVIPVQNEEKTIGAVINEVKKLNPMEIIVILNGTTDRTVEIVKNLGCTIITYVEALGNDVGRAIGAKNASGDILLFLDGDIVVAHKELLPFIEAIRNGYDIALNDLSFLANIKQTVPYFTTVSKLAVNAYLQQNSLSLNSLLAVPHAIKRDAIKQIGWRNLADPILTQAIAISQGLRICSPTTVDVIKTNRIRPVHSQIDTKSRYPVTTSRIIGDHLRALNYLISLKGPRGGFFDKNSDRNKTLKLPLPLAKKSESKYCAVLAVSENCQLVSPIITQAKLAGIEEIILVVHKIKKETIEEVRLKGVIVIELQENFHPNTARLIGAMSAQAEICTFLNENEVIPANDLKLYMQAIEQGADIALNNRKQLLDSFNHKDLISTGQYFVNMAVNRPDLYNNGISFLPFSFHQKALKTIGYESIIVPALAQLKAIQAGLKIVTVQKNLNINNKNEENLNTQQIMGDQLEAIAYILQQTNERGGFMDGWRKREYLT